MNPARPVFGRLDANFLQVSAHFAASFKIYKVRTFGFNKFLVIGNTTFAPLETQHLQYDIVALFCNDIFKKWAAEARDRHERRAAAERRAGVHRGEEVAGAGGLALVEDAGALL